MGPFGNKAEKPDKDASERAASERLTALSLDDLAAEVMPAFGPNGINAKSGHRQGPLEVVAFLLPEAPVKYRQPLLAPVIEALGMLEHANMVTRGSFGKSGRASSYHVTRFRETALADGTVPRRRGHKGQRVDTPDESTSTNRRRAPTPAAAAGGPSFVLNKSDRLATSPGLSRTPSAITRFYLIVNPSASADLDRRALKSAPRARRTATSSTSWLRRGTQPAERGQPRRAGQNPTTAATRRSCALRPRRGRAPLVLCERR